MENGVKGPEVSRAVENGVKEPDEDEGIATDLVMCSTCSCFVYRKERTSVPKPEEEVVEVVREAEKMRDLLMAVLLHGPLQEMEPAQATKEQWQVLRRRRRVMMETKRCPTCSASLSEVCLTCSKEEGSELMSVIESLGLKERKKIAKTEDEAMVFISDHKLKRWREVEEAKRAKSEAKEGSGSKKKKASSEMEGSGSKDGEMSLSEETKMQITRLLTKVLDLLEQAPPVKLKEEENSESAVGNRKTKMVTRRMEKEDIDFLKNLPPTQPLYYDRYLTNKDTVDTHNNDIAVEAVFLEYLQYAIAASKGYAEYQEEVSDDEDDEGDDHKLV